MLPVDQDGAPPEGRPGAATEPLPAPPDDPAGDPEPTRPLPSAEEATDPAAGEPPAPARFAPGPERPAGPPPGPRPRGNAPPREHRARPAPASGSRPKSRLPAHMVPTQVLSRLARERQEALDVRDPIAIALAAERYNTLAAILEPFDPDRTLDMHQPLLSVSQTAKLLGYNAKEVRRLLGQGKIAGRKVGNEWRIPLWAVL